MRSRWKIAAGVFDAAFASLATFGIGIFAIRHFEPAVLGSYALVFAAFSLVVIIPRELVFVPAEVASISDFGQGSQYVDPSRRYVHLQAVGRHDAGLPEAEAFVDWQNFATAPYVSSTHGDRFVTNHVNEAGAEAYPALVSAVDRDGNEVGSREFASGAYVVEAAQPRNPIIPTATPAQMKLGAATPRTRRKASARSPTRLRRSGSRCEARSARSPAPISFTSPRRFRKPARARSCAASCARSPRTIMAASATPARSRTPAWSTA
jgi:hypothetical protein